jgi:hypothetical protein
MWALIIDSATIDRLPGTTPPMPSTGTWSVWPMCLHRGLE